MYPLLFEVNTRCWLRDLSERCGHGVSLANVPREELASWKSHGVTHVWLMGVWRTGLLARARALVAPGLREACRAAAPEWKDEFLGASPYAISDYTVEEELGGEEGLRSFRRQLQAAGMRLILDFVPNHLGLDHRWIEEHPDRFVQSAVEIPEAFLVQGRGSDRWLAHGKDPFWPAWTDTVQLDYRLGSTRAAMAEQLAAVAGRCDGVRCDMAMLLLPDVIEKNWGHLPPDGQAEPGNFWQETIPRIRSVHPGFLFLAEVYWGLERRLQDLGFDYTYDKVFMDQIVERNPAGLMEHLLGMERKTLAASAHFLENHDEERIAGRLTLDELRPAVLLLLALPGLRFLYEGQMEGRKLRAPVQLLRRRPEPPHEAIYDWYRRLLTLLPDTSIGKGTWELRRLARADAPAHPGDPQAEHVPEVLLIDWRQDAHSVDLVVINLGSRNRAGVATIEKPLPDAIWEVCQVFGDSLAVAITQHGSAVSLGLTVPARGAAVVRLTGLRLR